jgi:RNA polymerase sigma factor (sigma-70 family)
LSSAEQRFRHLHAEAYDDLMRFVRRRVPADDAEDIVSTVFMTVWRRLDDVPADARPWMFAVARNVLANQARVRLRHGVVDVRMVADEDPWQSDDAAGAATRVDLVRAWWKLSTADREVLALVAFDGLTPGQAAVVLGCRRSTFTMRLTRARRRLRAALDAGRDTTPIDDVRGRQDSWSEA